MAIWELLPLRIPHPHPHPHTTPPPPAVAAKTGTASEQFAASCFFRCIGLVERAEHVSYMMADDGMGVGGWLMDGCVGGCSIGLPELPEHVCWWLGVSCVHPHCLSAPSRSLPPEFVVRLPHRPDDLPSPGPCFYHTSLFLFNRLSPTCCLPSPRPHRPPPAAPLTPTRPPSLWCAPWT